MKHIKPLMGAISAAVLALAIPAAAFADPFPSRTISGRFPAWRALTTLLRV